MPKPTRTPSRDLQTNNYRAAILANGYRPAVPWAQSISLRPGTLRHRAGSSLPRLAEDFLCNTRLLRNDLDNEMAISNYLGDAGVAMLSLMGEEDHGTLAVTSLPDSISLDLKLERALYDRSSTRTYTGDAIDLKHLATVVRAAAGMTREVDVQCAEGGSIPLCFRTVPSAGGLYPIELHLAVLNVNGLNPGIYKYHPQSDSLLTTGGDDILASVLETFAAPEELISRSHANFIALLFARPWRTTRKYGHRGLRFIFHEAGAISQNIHLAVGGLGLGSVDCAGIYDDEVHAALNIDGLYTALVHSVVVGVPG
jgi:SagB-type dehydrogenase family enzyme